MAEPADHSCPFKILSRYVEAANIDLNSSNLSFRTVYFCKSKRLYKLRSTSLSYSRTRELVLSAFSSLGYSPKAFGLHSLRSGGATAAANAGVHDRLFKRHRRGRSETAKDGYVKTNWTHFCLFQKVCICDYSELAFSVNNKFVLQTAFLVYRSRRAQIRDARLLSCCLIIALCSLAIKCFMLVHEVLEYKCISLRYAISMCCIVQVTKECTQGSYGVSI